MAEIIPDPSRLLMSDSLKDMLADDTTVNKDMEALALNYVIAVVTKDENKPPIVGTLESIMCCSSALKVELKVQLDEGLNIVKEFQTGDVNYVNVELHCGEDVTPFKPQDGFTLVEVLLGPIDYRLGMCVLALNLRYGA
jgi:hypothetical protein